MSDHTASHLALARTPRSEFRVYYAMIFLVALPFELIAWPFRALRHRGTSPGPVARARMLATEITPMIFWP